MINRALETRIHQKDFWICWYALHAKGWHGFFWGLQPRLVRISLYHGWYQKTDLVSFFFAQFFDQNDRNNMPREDFLLESTMDLLDLVRPFNDIFVDAFLDMSWQDWPTVLTNLVFGTKGKRQWKDEKSVFLIFCIVWPWSLGHSYFFVLKKVVTIIKIIKKK